MLQIQASTDNGQTLKKFAEVIQKRMEWTKTSARNSIAACMINVLKSLRALTLVAKPSSSKPDVEIVDGLVLSFYTTGGTKRKCLRISGSNVRYYPQDQKVIYPLHIGKGTEKTWRVWKFVDEHSKKKTEYLIVAQSKSAAASTAKGIVKRRLMRYRGLAKRAVSIMIGKTYTGAKTPNDGFGLTVESTAQKVVAKIESVKQNGADKGTYTLVLDDRLRYATSALKNGKASVDLAFKKAANKVISVINQKIKDGKAFFSDKLDTPFPEVRRK